MINFIAGCVLGFMVATVGFTGIAQALDKTIDTAKTVSIKVDTGK
jgi:capsular polysaccharide biosynthesis protein